MELPLLLNYLTAPDVLIWSASCASCALPLLYEPQELMAKDVAGHIRPYHPSCVRWSDGSTSSEWRSYVIVVRVVQRLLSLTRLDKAICLCGDCRSCSTSISSSCRK